MLQTLTHDGKPETLRELIRHDPESPVATDFRRWHLQVLQPLNHTAATAIIQNAHLVEGFAHLEHLRNFVAHVMAYKIVTDKWSTGEPEMLKITRCGIPYPDELHDIIELVCLKLKDRQNQLIGSAL